MPESFKNLVKFLKENNINVKGVIILSFIISTIGSVITVILPYIAKLEVDQLQYQNLFPALQLTPFGVFIVIVVAYILGEILNNIIWTILRIKKDFLEDRLKFEINKVMLKRFFDSQYWLFFDAELRRLLEEAFRKGGEIWQSIVGFADKILSTFITVVGISYVFWQVNEYILVILVVGALIEYWVDNYLEYILVKNEVKKLEKVRVLNWLNNQLLYFPVAIVTSGRGRYFLKRINSLSEDIIRLTNKDRRDRERVRNIKFTISSIVNGIVKIWVGYIIFYMWASIGVLTMTLMYTTQIYRIFISIFSFRKDYFQTLFELDFFNFFLEWLKDSKIWDIKSGDIKNIKVQDLRFKYPSTLPIKKKYMEIYQRYVNKVSGRDLGEIDYLSLEEKQNPWVLKWIDMDFEPGKVFGIVGKNWAGKTTLVNLFLRAFDTKGIFLNDKDIERFRRSFLTEKIGMIFQNVEILPLSIRENISLDKKIDDKKLWEILEKVWLKDKIQNLPDWLDTFLEDDTNFSWWEKQLLNFARILAQDYQVVILDEWTNQLDVENENNVIKILHEIKKDKIVIFITHRMSVMNKADFIYCLEDGVIESSGSPQELLQKDSLFKRFFEKEINRTL